MPEGFVELRLGQTHKDSQAGLPAFPGTRAALEEVIGAPLQAAQPGEMVGSSQRPPERAPHRAYLAQDPPEHYAQELPPSFADSQHNHKQQQQQQQQRTASDADKEMGTDAQVSSRSLPGVYLNPDTLLPMEHKQPAPPAWYDVSQYLWAQAQGAEGKGINAPLQPAQAGGGLRIQSGEIAL